MRNPLFLSPGRRWSAKKIRFPQLLRHPGTKDPPDLIGFRIRLIRSVCPTPHHHPMQMTPNPMLE